MAIATSLPGATGRARAASKTQMRRWQPLATSLQSTTISTRVALCAVLLVGCSSAGDLPLGGPFGALAAGSSGGVFLLPGGSGSGGGGTSAIASTITSGSGATSSTTATTSASGPGASSGTAGSSSTQATAGSGTGTSSSAASASSSSAPTWTDLYNAYLAVGTVGGCDSSSCHRHTECSSPSACWSWIGTGQQGGLTRGSAKPLFSWDNGDMPTNGPTSDPQADAAFAAWIAAGSKDN
jgi:hypothetical protein